MRLFSRRAIVCTVLLVHGAARLCVAAPSDSTRAVQIESPQEGAVPSPGQILLLRGRMHGLARVRLVTREGSLLAGAPSVSDEGIQARDVTRRSGIGYRTDSKPRLIRWAEIESIQTQGGHATRNGALIGGLVGTIIGIPIGARQPCREGRILGDPGNCFEMHMMPVGGGAVAGAIIGALVGSRYDHLQTIYP